MVIGPIPKQTFPAGYLTIAGVKRDTSVQVTLTQQNQNVVYSRTYDCLIDQADNITFPNDLNLRTQDMLRGVVMLMKYPNTPEGDSFTQVQTTTATKTQTVQGIR